MDRETDMTLRNVFRVARYALCGSILAIAFVQGFFPGVDVNAFWPGAAGFLVAGLSTAKALAVLWVLLVEVLGFSVTTGMATVMVAILAGLISTSSCRIRKRHFSKTQFGSALLNGATIVPFAAIAVSPFSEAAKAAAMASGENLALAGLVGLFYVCSEVLLPSTEAKPS